jgi:hypothetical protein
MIWWSVRYCTALLVWLFWFDIIPVFYFRPSNNILFRESLAWGKVCQLRRERKARFRARRLKSTR